MDTSLKRIVAFVLDILLVTCVVTIITKWTPIDPYKDKYDDAYEEYMEILEQVKNEGSSALYYEDRIIELNYDIYQYRVVSSAISITALLLYFGLIQYFMDGQTVGKKVMNLKIVSNKDKKVNIGKYLLRVIILNNIIFTIISLVSVYLFKGKTFYYVTYVISLCESFVYMVNVLMVVIRKDNRGLHDITCGTKVIDLKPFEPLKEEESVEEVKEEPKLKSIKEKVDKVNKKKRKKK